MNNIFDPAQCTAEELYKTLRSLNGIDPLNARIHRLLCEMQPDIGESVKKLLYIYFSLLDDGNTRLALNCNIALTKWIRKWDGLIRTDAAGKNGCEFDCTDAESKFGQVIEAGICDILKGGCPRLIENREEGKITEKDAITKPFVRATDPGSSTEYLYATRYFDAKCIIEERARAVFERNDVCVGKKELIDCQDYFDQYLKEDDKGNKLRLFERQREAIVRGQRENLIITGGPGTGKTTVICFLLWKLLDQNPEMLNWDIRLAAPSGKAADRMRESLLGSLARFRDTDSQIYHKLRNLESYTLHRLLNYNPHTCKFSYNEDNRFRECTLFVIDEASMIDIVLFSKFMQAVPDKNYRLFILGDPDQLPSVEAGAVLGELLRTNGISVHLDESKRFSADSTIGRLARAIQEIKKLGTAHVDNWPEKYTKPVFQPYSKIDFLESIETQNNNVHYITLSTDIEKKDAELKGLIKSWVSAFYPNHFMELARKIVVGKDGMIHCDPNKLEELWRIIEQARILSSERQGRTGVENLNEMVRQIFAEIYKDILKNDGFFVGQLLMLTVNQASLKLYNGDCGIVIGEQGSGRLYLLLKKVSTQQNADSSDKMNNYAVYPLSLLPPDALESAFAITVHKSQGSGYGNVMLFLPTTVGHPLLNNPMIYTGVTRTEMISLTIVTTQEAFEAGCKTLIERDTGIRIDGI